MVGNWSLSPTESSIWSAINLSSLSLCSFAAPAIYPSLPVAKGPCLIVALIIWTNFLCNLFPSQPPTWSSSIRLLKVKPLIPASPLLPITSCFLFFFTLRESQIFCLLKFQLSTAVMQAFLLSLLESLTPLIRHYFPLMSFPIFIFCYHFPFLSLALSLSLLLSLLLSCHGSSVFSSCLVWCDFAQTRLALGKVRSPESLLRSPQVAGTMNTL